jgi:hypothetical protein
MAQQMRPDMTRSSWLTRSSAGTRMPRTDQARCYARYPALRQRLKRLSPACATDRPASSVLPLEYNLEEVSRAGERFA